jgi:hypothetical protein
VIRLSIGRPLAATPKSISATIRNAAVALPTCTTKPVPAGPQGEYIHAKRGLPDDSVIPLSMADAVGADLDDVASKGRDKNTTNSADANIGARGRPMQRKPASRAGY